MVFVAYAAPVLLYLFAFLFCVSASSPIRRRFGLPYPRLCHELTGSREHFCSAAGQGAPAASACCPAVCCCSLCSALSTCAGFCSRFLFPVRVATLTPRSPGLCFCFAVQMYLNSFQIRRACLSACLFVKAVCLPCS